MAAVGGIVIKRAAAPEIARTQAALRLLAGAAR
jgi:hypothetical protein